MPGDQLDDFLFYSNLMAISYVMYIKRYAINFFNQHSAIANKLPKTSHKSGYFN